MIFLPNLGLGSGRRSEKKNLEELIPNTHRNDDEQRELTFQVLAGKGKSSLEKRRKAFVGLGKAKAKKIMTKLFFDPFFAKISRKCNKGKS